ncbi:MAG: hypothetical protein RL609_1533, partial [Bacteroidota bacterium]
QLTYTPKAIERNRRQTNVYHPIESRQQAKQNLGLVFFDNTATKRMETGQMDII